jgi:hypothetical protein
MGKRSIRLAWPNLHVVDYFLKADHPIPLTCGQKGDNGVPEDAEVYQEELGPITITGEVATVTFVVEFDDPYGQLATFKTQGVRRGDTESFEGEGAILYRLRTEDYDSIQNVTRRLVQDALGPRFDVEPLTIRSGGSIEIIAIITAISAILGSYNELMSRLPQAIENTRRALRTIFEGINALRRPVQFQIRSRLALGPAAAQTYPVVAQPPVRPRRRVWDPIRILLWTTVLDTVLVVVVLALVIWLLTRSS